MPMVDVLTALIFFFLLTMQFKNINSVDITPPKMDSAGRESKQKPDTISVDKTGKYYFNAKEVSLGDLKAEINSRDNPAEAALILLSDRDTPLHFVTSVIDIVRLAGIKKLSLQTASEN